MEGGPCAAVNWNGVRWKRPQRGSEPRSAVVQLRCRCSLRCWGQASLLFSFFFFPFANVFVSRYHYFIFKFYLFPIWTGVFYFLTKTKFSSFGLVPRHFRSLLLCEGSLSFIFPWPGAGGRSVESDRRGALRLGSGRGTDSFIVYVCLYIVMHRIYYMSCVINKYTSRVSGASQGLMLHCGKRYPTCYSLFSNVFDREREKKNSYQGSKL